MFANTNIKDIYKNTYLWGSWRHVQALNISVWLQKHNLTSDTDKTWNSDTILPLLHVYNLYKQVWMYFWSVINIVFVFADK